MRGSRSPLDAGRLRVVCESTKFGIVLAPDAIELGAVHITKGERAHDYGRGPFPTPLTRWIPIEGRCCGT
jgi:hypothetical protein